MPDDNLPPHAPPMDPVSPLTPEVLAAATKEQLARMLGHALGGLRTSLQNTQQLTDLLKVANDRIKELESQNKSQEAELIMLRN
jgi:hypothetical protein